MEKYQQCCPPNVPDVGCVAQLKGGHTVPVYLTELKEYVAKDTGQTPAQTFAGMLL